MNKSKSALAVLSGFLFLVSPLSPCTFFMSHVKGITYFGNNEDYRDRDTNIWFIPPQDGRHGYLYFGYNNGWPQGGMNDQGLCFDGASTPRINIRFSADKQRYQGNLIDKIMEECSTVDEVLAMVKTYAFTGLGRQGQLLFADKAGAAVIIGGPSTVPDSDLDIVKPSENFMVCTNFFPNHKNLGGFPCRRYRTAVGMLIKNSEPTVENFRSILEAVSGPSTLYSNIFDLNQCEITLYLLHEFTRPLTIKLEDEFKKGAHAYKIRHMFSDMDSTPGLLESINQKRKAGSISQRIPEFIAFQ